MLRHVLLAFSFLCIFLCDGKAGKNCRNLKSDGLVPEYVEKVTPQCAVKFSEGVSADCGNTLPSDATSTEPTITFELPEQNCKNATIVSIDPDAFGLEPPFLHELSSNIPRECLQKGYHSTTCKAGDLQASFISPGGSNHRYLFCVYCQKEYIEPHQYGLLEDELRTGFDMMEYARSRSLSVKACNYFRLKLVPTVSNVMQS